MARSGDVAVLILLLIVLIIVFTIACVAMRIALCAQHGSKGDRVSIQLPDGYVEVYNGRQHSRDALLACFAIGEHKSGVN